MRDAIRAANADASRGNCTAGSGTDVIFMPDNYSVVLTSDLPTLQPIDFQSIVVEFSFSISERVHKRY